MIAFLGHSFAGGEWANDGMNPKPINKLSLGAKSYVTIRLGRAFSHSPKFFCPALKIDGTHSTFL